MAEDNKPPKKETRNPWTWAELSAESAPTTEVLILRYLANPQCGGYSREELRRLANADSVDTINQALYGRQRRAARRLVAAIAESMGTSPEELSIAAKNWSTSGKDDPDFYETVPLRGSDISRNYYFRKSWILSMGAKSEDLFAIKVPDQLLAEDGLYESDLLLVDTKDKEFWPGAFFVVEICDMLRIYRGIVQFNQQCLCVDRSGTVIASLPFKEATILGRAIWRGTKLR